jgi:hypothetical protein
MSGLSKTNIHIQRILFPALEEEFGTLSKKECQFVRVLELAEIEPFLADLGWCGNGRPPASRLALAKAFIAKAVWDIPTTSGLIERIKAAPNLRRLCGWDSLSDIPSESVFSRAFAQFALRDLSANIHRTMIETHMKEHIVGHISRDSTAIKAREKPLKKKTQPKAAKKRGRPKKGEVRVKKKRRLEEQPARSLKKNLKELPKACDVGTKRNSKGYKESWTGYKMHIDVADGDIPVSAILTSASVHDSQAAVPLAQMSAQRVTNLYDLMDAAYDAPEIHAISRRLGHVPIIDHNPRRGSLKKKMDPPEQERLRERSAAERVNSNLKDNHGGRHVRVRGHKKVYCHLMFGLLVVAASQLFNLLL